MATMISAICEMCEKPFTYAVKIVPRKFCSRRCADNAKVFIREDPVDRFWRYADTDGHPHGCWPWTGGITPAGYGTISIPPRRNVYAHRFSYAMRHGDPGDLFVLHNCDKYYPRGDISYRRCVNPDHLFSGTHNDNLQDMARKGRSNRQKLDEDQVRHLRALRVQGFPQRRLATMFSVSLTTVQNILARRTFKYVT